MQYGRAVFVPEYGSILSWGGGGHGASRMGNDVWMYNTAKNEWRQMTPGDPMSGYPTRPRDASSETVPQRQLVRLLLVDVRPRPTFRPAPRARARPELRDLRQRAWDSYNRRFVIFGPNYITGQMDGPIGWFAARGSYAYDPYLAPGSFSPTIRISITRAARWPRSHPAKARRGEPRLHHSGYNSSRTVSIFGGST
jgi:hypothetical protein